MLTAAKQGTPQTAAFFALALESGARKGELQGLRWFEVDLDAGTVRIRRQFIEQGEKSEDGSPVFRAPKTGNTRSINLSAETVTLLREHKRTQAELKLKNRLHYDDHGLVFAQAWEHKRGPRTALGKPLTSHAILMMMKAVTREAKVRRITVHGLGHTCATLMLKNGEQVHVVRDWLGHASAATTLKYYGHVLQSMQQDAAKRMGTMLHG